MNILQWQARAHEIALEKGFWVSLEEDRANMTPDIFCSKLMLIVSELAEACEEVRSKNAPTWFLGHGPVDLNDRNDVMTSIRFAEGGDKPEGTLIELADTVIRILDLCAFMGWNLEQAMNVKCAFNKTRPERHGGKAL
jgi:hypothetical protein